MNLLLACLYATAVWGSYVAGALRARAERDEQRRAPAFRVWKVPPATLVLTILVATGAVLQLLFPALLTTFERNGPLLVQGEWWRLVTSLVVQDGGLSGTVFNIVSLLLVGGLTEHYWRSRRWLIIFAVSGIVGGAVGLAWQPVGAGTSVAIFGLAGSLALVSLRNHPLPSSLVSASLAIAASLLLLLLKDIHGPAAVTGMVLASIMRERHRQTGSWEPEAGSSP